MHHPEDPADDENWYGGFYELAINLGPRSDARLGKALAAVWRAAGVDRCLARDDDGRHRDAVLSVESIERYGHLAGVTTLPDHGHIVCGAVTIREEQGDDWLDFYLPLGALGRHDPRVGAFPFGDDGGAVSRSWRDPLHQWLNRIGEETFNAVPFLYAGIGFEVSGLSLDELTGSRHRYFHVLAVRDSQLEIQPVTRWDFGAPG